MKSLSQTVELAEAIGGFGSLVKVAARVPRNCTEEILNDVRELQGLIIQITTLYRNQMYTFLRLPDEEQTPDKIKEHLANTSLLATELGRAAQRWAEEERPPSDVFPDWHFEGLKRIADLADELRDIEETLALGQSGSFQQELKSAKREATN